MIATFGGIALIGWIPVLFGVPEMRGDDEMKFALAINGCALLAALFILPTQIGSWKAMSKPTITFTAAPSAPAPMAHTPAAKDPRAPRSYMRCGCGAGIDVTGARALDAAQCQHCGAAVTLTPRMLAENMFPRRRRADLPPTRQQVACRLGRPESLAALTVWRKRPAQRLIRLGRNVRAFGTQVAPLLVSRTEEETCDWISSPSKPSRRCRMRTRLRSSASMARLRRCTCCWR